MSPPEDKYLDSLKKHYARASRKERSKMLDEYVETTGYSRKYAIAILTQKRKRAQRPIRRPRRTIYTGEEAWVLDELSNWFDGINSKRLRAAMDNAARSSVSTMNRRHPVRCARQSAGVPQRQGATPRHVQTTRRRPTETTN